MLAWPEVLLYLLGTFSSVDQIAREFTLQAGGACGFAVINQFSCCLHLCTACSLPLASMPSPCVHACRPTKSSPIMHPQPSRVRWPTCSAPQTMCALRLRCLPPWLGACLAPRRRAPAHAQVPVHLSLYDASGDGAVIEFDGNKARSGCSGQLVAWGMEWHCMQLCLPGQPQPGEFNPFKLPPNQLQGWTIYRQVSAVTNMPTYPEQLENLRRWRAARLNTTCGGGGRRRAEEARGRELQPWGPAALCAVGEAHPTTFSLLYLCRQYVMALLQGAYEAVYLQPPGSYSSAARFVRLHELLTQVRLGWLDGTGVGISSSSACPAATHHPPSGCQCRYVGRMTHPTPPTQTGAPRLRELGCARPPASMHHGRLGCGYMCTARMPAVCCAQCHTCKVVLPHRSCPPTCRMRRMCRHARRWRRRPAYCRPWR